MSPMPKNPMLTDHPEQLPGPEEGGCHPCSDRSAHPSRRQVPPPLLLSSGRPSSSWIRPQAVSMVSFSLTLSAFSRVSFSLKLSAFSGMEYMDSSAAAYFCSGWLLSSGPLPHLGLFVSPLSGIFSGLWDLVSDSFSISARNFPHTVSFFWTFWRGLRVVATILAAVDGG